jgi:archaellum component FlaC
LSSDNKNITDIDMVILEKTTASLILLQLKWPIRPKSTLDLFNKDKEIENGIEQASKAYEYVSNNLDIFMKNQFSDEKDINIQKINSLVVVRDNIGTSAIYGKNIPVVDYDYFISQISNLDRAIIKIVENAIGHPYLPKKDKDFKVVRRKIQIANYLLEFPIAEMD